MQQLSKFKKTVLGEIPQDWNLIKLSDLCDLITDGVHFTPKYQVSGVPFVSVNNMSTGKLDFSNCKYISREDHNELIKRCAAKKGDLLLSKVGTLGIADVIDVEFEFSIFVQLALIKPTKTKIDPIYLKNILNSPPLQKQINSFASGSTLRYIGINKISNLIIPYPDIKEQNKIAFILSKVDELIQKTDQIIEQTQRLKKGLMYTLLTKGIGHRKFKKTELGEIPDDWDIFKLGDVCSIRKDYDKINSELYIGLEHIGRQNNNLILKGNIKDFTSNKNAFLRGDVIYGKLRPLLNKVYLTQEDGYCSTDILPLVANDKISNKILLWTLSSTRFVNYADSNSSGTKMPRTRWNDMEKYLIPLGKITEQQKIASILSNIDLSIQWQKKNKFKNQNLKKGLMHQLLTGKIRVKV